MAFQDWDFDPEDVATQVVWWHGRDDANCPLPAVLRLCARLPSVNLRLWDDAGHMAPYHREEEILSDLLAREPAG
jgi:pimeloyl-ACP methyl ester carboxylesterase